MDQCPPILFIIFNRPDVTARVFSRIREARPHKLYIAADGPRPDVPGESRRCEETRNVVGHIDWSCEVHRLYSETNLGCKKAVILAINWIFEHVEQAIILEDDCLPDPSFFRFSGVMLDYYQDDKRVMHISGSNLAPEASSSNAGYFFSRFVFCWGWATWRRAWRLYDPDMTAWPSLRETNWLRSVLKDRDQADYWTRRLDFIMEHERQLTWDYQWLFTCWKNNSVNISPGVNLVANIGCGPNATNVVDGNDCRANLPTGTMRFPIRHPVDVKICPRTERAVFRKSILNEPTAVRRVLRLIRSRYFWGGLIRRVPILGLVWTQWRNRRARSGLNPRMKY